MSVLRSSAAMSGDHVVGRRVALVTLGCARNEVDSEELAARLTAGGWSVTTDPDGADVLIVNTCGFIEKAKRDSIEVLLSAVDSAATVVAAGCLAQRYGDELSETIPELASVVGFSGYRDISAHLSEILGQPVPSPRTVRVPAPVRARLSATPVAPLKLATGCDRRCAFCAIPSIRGPFTSRDPDDVLAEAEWLAAQGVRELLLVSENSTSYGKDLGAPRLLERLLGDLSSVQGIARIRLSYLQPAEIRPGVLEAVATTPKIAAYFDLSFQHSSESVLRRMRRFGSTRSFLGLIDQIRALAPDAGIRGNVIVGFPGETRDDLAELEDFLVQARLDAIGVFDYSDEEGTEAATLGGKVAPATIAGRYAHICDVAEHLVSARAMERVGSVVEVLVDENGPQGVEGRAEHQAPEVDGSTTLTGGGLLDATELRPGDLVRATVTDGVGVDLVATPVELVSAGASDAALACEELG